ncbi:MAG: glucosylceramidase [Bacteroidales bacterium]|nr:glucosylceramidase [Bacteroidales bacterium]
MIEKCLLLCGLSILTVLTPAASCTEEDEPPTSSTRTSRGASAFTSWYNKSGLMTRTAASYTNGEVASPYAVRLTDQRYQTVEGFGAAITPASCYNLMKMPEAERTAFLKEFFSPEEGMGASLVRISIGGSDFSLDFYTWEDRQGSFAPHNNDLSYVIPILKEIKAINPELRIIASPWTAPAWMKENAWGNNGFQGGHLAAAHYDDYATYLVKWLRHFSDEGLEVLAITLQNESLTDANPMSMRMNSDEAAAFVKKLGPAVRNAGLTTKLLVYDHNYDYEGDTDQKKYPLNIYADSDAAQYVAGSAWHGYHDPVTELDDIRLKAPDKEIWFTEASIGTWWDDYDDTKFSQNLSGDFRKNFMGTLKRNGKGVTLWNLMLDNRNGPSLGPLNCYGVVTLKDDNKTLIRNSQYYEIAHCARVIRPGAVRVGTEGYTRANIDYLAFVNPDGSWAVIVQNDNQDSQQMVFVSMSHSVKTTIPGNSIVSLTWKD